MRVVIALGGNAMSAADGSARPEDQRAAIEVAAEPIADLVQAGHQLVITHGNGPQVGNLLVKNELAAAVVPPVPLDWCGAQTQATIGVLLLNALDSALARRGSAVRTAALVSRTSVDVDDVGFTEPSKPIGRYLTADEAALMVAHGQHWQDRGARGWRRVVASPEPVECLDAPAASALLAAGYLVICSGGGGIPVVTDVRHGYRGVEAVIDKDYTAALLAGALDADLLVIATDVEHVVIGWDSPQARPLGRVALAELELLAAEGNFAGGSMGPKVSAACRFVARTGRPAAITSLGQLGGALDGSRGTQIVPKPDA
ncbi:MAG: carbamate kinase [Actinomycetota bacterium]|nr:carbamate kinase [Actinomycetota bacterium]MDQ2958022.1 carbamate kinase [Actinomycetota bacterium]